MEDWIVNHRITLEKLTGWTIRSKEATDDRVGHMVEMIGREEESMLLFQQQVGQNLIQAYELPTEVVRYDTTSFNVYHTASEEGKEKGLLGFGHSKDHRSDLLQFKQGLGNLDPAGVPLFTNTIRGPAADDPLYLPAWQEMVKTIGHSKFLYVADCKAGALLTRAAIDHEKGYYLFPLPMTGETPDLLRQWVLKPPVTVADIYLLDVTDKEGKPVLVGYSFSQECSMQCALEDGTVHTWTERWLVTQSLAHARRIRTGLQERLTKTTAELGQLKAHTAETRDSFQARAERIVKQRQLNDLLNVTVVEHITTRKEYENRGRPGANSPYTLVEERHLELDLQPNSSAIEEQHLLAGWRIYVINLPPASLSLEQAMAYYRDEGEHFFRFGKQRLLFTAFQTPEAEHEENWWQIVQLAYRMLWLSRSIAVNLPNPWERYLQQARNGVDSPASAQRDFGRIIRQIGTPAAMPKRRGNSPGRRKDTLIPPRPRLAVVKKAETQPVAT